MSKILIIGDTVAPYHPLNSVLPLNKALVEFKLTFTNDYDYFSRLNEFDLLICAVDSWFTTADAVEKAVSIGALPSYNEGFSKEISNGQVTAILDYLNNGGKLLSIHTGMSIQETPGLEAIHGAKFTGHPPYCEILINVKKGHQLTEGVNDFQINDEPYHFEVYEDLDVFASYEFDGNIIPAAWEKVCGKGKLIYLMPGHDEKVFESENYLRLIKNCVDYLV